MLGCLQCGCGSNRCGLQYVGAARNTALYFLVPLFLLRLLIFVPILFYNSSPTLHLYHYLEYDTIQDQRRRQCSIFHSTHCPLFKQCSIFLNPLFYSALFSTAVLYLPGVNMPICSEFNYKIHAIKHKQLSF